MRRPTRLLALGLLLFAFTAGALGWVDAATKHWLVAVLMAVGGLGLGLLLPNLTIFVQQSAPRQQLGVATAMIQSTRMIGGMLGTALVGVFVTRRYAAGVDALPVAPQWLAWLRDPQILLNAETSARFEQLAAAPSSTAARCSAPRGWRWWTLFTSASGWWRRWWCWASCW